MMKHNLRPTLAALKSGGFHLCDSPQHDRSIRIALLEGNNHHGAYLNSGAVERRQRPALSPVNANLYSARGPRVSIIHDYSSVNAKPCHWPLPWLCCASLLSGCLTRRRLPPNTSTEGPATQGTSSISRTKASVTSRWIWRGFRDYWLSADADASNDAISRLRRERA